MGAVVELKGIRCQYGQVVAVHGLDLSLQAGRVVGLLGPNGSGKSTTLRTMLGLGLPDRGQVRLFGGVPDLAARRRVGWVPERLSLSVRDRVGELLSMMLALRGLPDVQVRDRRDRWLGLLDLTDLRTRRLSQLSKGQQQRVQVALAMAHHPDLLVLDEPFTGLDPRYQRTISALFHKAARDGAAVILSTHRLREAQELVDDVVMMHLGRKVLEGPLEGLRTAHATDRYVLLFEGAADWLQAPLVAQREQVGETWEVRLIPGGTSTQLMQLAADAGVELVRFERVRPSLAELFAHYSESQ